jgi:hypothetical protein
VFDTELGSIAALHNYRMRNERERAATVANLWNPEEEVWPRELG